MQSGKLNRRVSILEQSSTQDESGQYVDTWKPILSTWASIRAATGKEVYAASGFTSQLSHVITLRYNPAVTIRSSHRVQYQDRIFDIQEVSDRDEGRAQINLLCLERNEGQ